MNKNRNLIIAVISSVLVTAAVTFTATAGLFYYYNYKQTGTALLFSSNVSADDIRKFNDVKQKLEKYFYKEIDETKLLEGATSGLAEALQDPYTVYFTKQQMQDFTEKSSGNYSGIGVYITTDPKDHLITVINPIEGSPAEKAGLKPGDKIIKVDGQDVSLEDEDKIVSMIKGKEGTNVKITVFRPSLGAPIDFDMLRQKINIKNITSEVLEGNIGYIKLVQFDVGLGQEFEQELANLTKKGIKGLLIDLRDNPGGSYTEVVKIADRLLPKGVIVYTEDRNQRREYKYSDDNQLNLPMTVLVNGYSASASEILSAAIKDHKKGTIVGTTTFGKGLVQTLFPLDDGAGLKITIQRYFTPAGESIHEKGVVPDVEIQLPEKDRNKAVSQLKREEDIQFQKAMEILKQKMR